jgi:hypothetical protein
MKRREKHTREKNTAENIGDVARLHTELKTSNFLE